jgi:hypothetical protein
MIVFTDKLSYFESYISEKRKELIMDPQRKKYMIALYIVLRYVLEVVDLGLDWEFYVEVTDSDQESIIRAVGVKRAILGFAIIGSVIFLLTFIIFSFGVYIKRKHDNISEETEQRVKDALVVLSFICIWLEDLPQIALAVVVAVKSTELISNIQLAKAWYALSEAVIETVINIAELKECIKNKEKIWNRVLVISELVGNIFILSIAAFLLKELYQDNFK